MALSSSSRARYRGTCRAMSSTAETTSIDQLVSVLLRSKRSDTHEHRAVIGETPSPLVGQFRGTLVEKCEGRKKNYKYLKYLWIKKTSMNMEQTEKTSKKPPINIPLRKFSHSSALSNRFCKGVSVLTLLTQEVQTASNVGGTRDSDCFEITLITESTNAIRTRQMMLWAINLCAGTLKIIRHPEMDKTWQDTRNGQSSFRLQSF